MSEPRSAPKTARADADTSAPTAPPSAPFKTRTQQTSGAPLHRFPGLRGRALANRRNAAEIGQAHVAHELGFPGPLLSFLERERYGGMPRGMSTRYQQALTRIADGESPCFPHCGCRWQEAA